MDRKTRRTAEQMAGLVARVAHPGTASPADRRRARRELLAALQADGYTKSQAGTLADRLTADARRSPFVMSDHSSRLSVDVSDLPVIEIDITFPNGIWIEKPKS